MIEQVPDHLRASELRRKEERRLTLAISHRIDARDARRQAGYVGDAGVHVGSSLAQDLHRFERESDDVLNRPGTQDRRGGTPCA